MIWTFNQEVNLKIDLANYIIYLIFSNVEGLNILKINTIRIILYTVFLWKLEKTNCKKKFAHNYGYIGCWRDP